MNNITPEMIAAKILEIEEPLITADEIGIKLGSSSTRINWLAHKLKIQPYRIKEGNYYKNAYDKDMVKIIIQEIKNMNIVTRKNILDINDLLC